MKVSVSANDAIWQQHLANGFQQVCRRWMIQVLERFMKVERTLFLGCLPYERHACRRGSRNGYEPRWLETKSGSLRDEQPPGGPDGRGSVGGYPFTRHGHSGYRRAERGTGRIPSSAFPTRVSDQHWQWFIRGCRTSCACFTS